MAKCYSQKARKEYVCEKCGKPIHKGDQYFKIEAMYAKTRYRCCDCRPERSELTSSDYLSWLYDLQDNLSDRYDLRSEEGKDELYSELESKKDELECNLDNMPQQLQEVGSGEILRARIDSLESAMSTIEDVEFPDEDDDEFQAEEEELTCIEVSIDSKDEELLSYEKTFVDLSESEVEGILCDSYGLKEVDRTYTTKDFDDFEVVTYVDDEDNKVICTYKRNTYFDEDAYNEALDNIECEIADAVAEICD